MLERDVLLTGVDETGQETIDLPITRLGNVEDGADIKDTPEEGDYVPVMDGADGGKMKKMPFQAMQVLSQESLARVKSLEKTVNGLEKLTGYGDPTAETVAQAGQTYINITTGGEWKCVAVNENGTVWEKQEGSTVGLTAADVGARPDTWMPTAADVGAVPATDKGKAGGVAALDASGKVPETQLPSLMPYVAGTSAPSDTKKLWIDTTANTGGLKYYNGSAWVPVPVAYT